MCKCIKMLFLLMLLLFLGTASVYATDSEKWEKIYKEYIKLYDKEFTLYDIDKNGVPELIVKEIGWKIYIDIFSIYTIKGNELVKVYTVNGHEQQQGFVKSSQLVNEGISFYDSLDANENSLYYTDTYISNITIIPQVQETVYTDIYKVSFVENKYISEKINTIVRKIIEFERKTVVEERFYIKEKYVDKESFLLDIPIRSRLGFINPHELLLYGWGPKLGYIPQYMMDTLFNRYNVSSASNTAIIEYPNPSNPKLKISSYYTTRKGIAGDTITVSYQNSMFDTVVYENDNHIPVVNILMVNGNFIPANNIIQFEQVIYLPLRRVCEQLGYQVEWTVEGTLISCNGILLDKFVPLYKENSLTIEGRIYVPMEYFEKINCVVQLTANYHHQMINKNLTTEFQIISIEKIYDKNLTISMQDATNSLWEALQESNRFTSKITDINGYPVDSLSEDYQLEIRDLIRGFNYEDIVNVGTLGRYYMFSLKNGKFNILMNKYSGEIYHVYFGIVLEIEIGL